MRLLFFVDLVLPSILQTKGETVDFMAVPSDVLRKRLLEFMGLERRAVRVRRPNDGFRWKTRFEPEWEVREVVWRYTYLMYRGT